MARLLVSDYAANTASSSGAWKSGEKSCFPGGNLWRDSASYVKPFVFDVLRGGLRSETGLRSRAVCSDFAGLRANANRTHLKTAKIIHPDFPHFRPSAETASRRNTEFSVG